jgi:hypothetical protein
MKTKLILALVGVALVAVALVGVSAVQYVGAKTESAQIKISWCLHARTRLE